MSVLLTFRYLCMQRQGENQGIWVPRLLTPLQITVPNFVPHLFIQWVTFSCHMPMSMLRVMLPSVLLGKYFEPGMRGSD